MRLSSNGASTTSHTTCPATRRLYTSSGQVGCATASSPHLAAAAPQRPPTFCQRRANARHGSPIPQPCGRFLSDQRARLSRVSSQRVRFGRTARQPQELRPHRVRRGQSSRRHAAREGGAHSYKSLPSARHARGRLRSAARRVLRECTHTQGLKPQTPAFAMTALNDQRSTSRESRRVWPRSTVAA